MADNAIDVSSEQAFAHMRLLMAQQGILAGISFGVARVAVLKWQQDRCFTNKAIVVILPSSGERYLSRSLFSDPEVMQRCHGGYFFTDMMKKASEKVLFCGLCHLFLLSSLPGM